MPILAGWTAEHMGVDVPWWLGGALLSAAFVGVLLAWDELAELIDVDSDASSAKARV